MGLYVSNVTVETVLQPHTCKSCGVLFALPREFTEQRRNDGQTWYCPNGHQWVYRDTEVMRLRRALEQQEANAEWYRDQLSASERSLSATRGVVTKLRKRAHAGTCPFGCRRHFVDLERHVASKHPGETLDGES
jgi:hypothetical protein